MVDHIRAGDLARPVVTPWKQLERPEGIGAPSGLLCNLSGSRDGNDIIPQKNGKGKYSELFLMEVLERF